MLRNVPDDDPNVVHAERQHMEAWQGKQHILPEKVVLNQSM